VTYTEDLALALELADIADAITRARFLAQDLLVEKKPDATEVTDADRATELAIKEMLAQERPEDGVIGEEFGTRVGNNRVWIIDPIDGTANFMRGVPVWATLIALAIDGKPVVSVVSAPALGRRWWAAPGVGARTVEINGAVRELSVSKVAQLEDASISYNNLKLWDRSGLLGGLLSLTRKVWRTRAYGDFWSYMLLAEGALDVVAEHDLKIYDIAALVPILEQAGGRLTAIDGELTETTSSVLATNGLLHEASSAEILG
jgi:histidinol-phosphatase